MMLDRYPELRQLSSEEKQTLADELWSETEPDPLLVAELQRRIAEYEKDPSQGSTWEEVRARILASRKVHA